MRVDHHDFRQLGQHGIDRVHVKLAEARRKAALLLGSERLAAKEQDLMLDQQFAEAVDGLLRQFIGEPDALDDGAKGRGQPGDGHVHGD